MAISNCLKLIGHIILVRLVCGAAGKRNPQGFLMKYSKIIGRKNNWQVGTYDIRIFGVFSKHTKGGL